jgi:hypothetical protein
VFCSFSIGRPGPSDKSCMFFFSLLAFAASQGFTQDHDLPASKYKERETLLFEDVVFGTDVSGLLKTNQCPIEIELVWMHQMDEGIFSTPVIAHMYGSSGRQIIVSSIQRQLTILDSEGYHLPGFPLSVERSESHSSPLLWDLNNDGHLDIIWTSVNGHVVLINGLPSARDKFLDSRLFIPKLKLRKHWYVGLAEQPNFGLPGDDLPLPGDEPSRKSNETTKDPTEKPKVAELWQGPLPQLMEGPDQIGDGLTPEARASFDLFIASAEAPVEFDEDEEPKYPLEEGT